MDYLDRSEEEILGRGLMIELEHCHQTDRIAAKELGRKNSLESACSSTNSSGSLVDESEVENVLAFCVENVKQYSGVSGIPGFPSLELEARIQCKFKELGLPDDGLPAPLLVQKYQTKCRQSNKALREIQSTIGSFYC